MSKTYDDIIKLDSERTQGDWESGHDPDGTNIVCTNKQFILETDEEANAQYIAAMPDAVRLLKKVVAALEDAVIVINSNPRGLYSDEDNRRIDAIYQIHNQLLQEPKP